MKLRIGVGYVMLALLVYYLFADRQFASEFFALSSSTLFTCALVCAFILPDKAAWIFQAGLALFWLVELLLNIHGVDPTSELITGTVLVVVFSALSYLTFRSGYKPRIAKLE